MKLGLTRPQKLGAFSTSLFLLLFLNLTGIAGAVAHAQTVDKIKAAADQLAKFLQQLGIIALVVTIPAGFFVLMFGGFTDNQRVMGIRIVAFSVLGALGLLLFAQPIADFIGETFKPN